MTPVKPEPTVEWMVRVFGSVQAWHRSRTRWRFVCRGRKRKQVIHLRLLSHSETKWQLPCPDRPAPDHVVHACRLMVTGIGPRPRLEYMQDGQQRIAVGRRGEPADRLRLYLWATYGPVYATEIGQQDDALAEYVAEGGNYRPYARKLGMRDQAFLAMAGAPAEVEKSVVMSDWQFERVWLLNPVYVVPAGKGDVSIGNPGDWAQDEVREEVMLGDPGGEVEKLPDLPMAIPKADGRGKQSLYFGFNLDYGGGCRWSLEAFEPPLRIALGGLLNRELGFGNSTGADKMCPYAGDGFHWSRNAPLAKRVAENLRSGPVCRLLNYPPID